MINNQPTTIKIYDFLNEEKIIPITKPIDSIEVSVISGDEIITINYKDGTSENHDASDDRYLDLYDGFYVVFEDQLEDWAAIGLDELDEDDDYISYKRLEKFTLEDFRC